MFNHCLRNLTQHIHHHQRISLEHQHQVTIYLGTIIRLWKGIVCYFNCCNHIWFFFWLTRGGTIGSEGPQEGLDMLLLGLKLEVFSIAKILGPIGITPLKAKKTSNTFAICSWSPIFSLFHGHFTHPHSHRTCAIV